MARLCISLKLVSWRNLLKTKKMKSSWIYFFYLNLITNEEQFIIEVFLKIYKKLNWKACATHLEPKLAGDVRKLLVHCNGGKIRLLRMKGFEVLFIFLLLFSFKWTLLIKLYSKFLSCLINITGNSLFLSQTSQPTKK